MPQIAPKRKLKTIKLYATEDEKRLLKERKKLYNKELFYKKERRRILERIHQIDRILGLLV